MSTARVLALGCVVLPFLVACGSNADEGTPAEQKQTPDPVGETMGEWKELITGDWTMPPGKEGYVCARKTVDHDMYITSFDAINPFGTHHTLLTYGDPDKEDGVIDCSVAENRNLSLFGSGVGTDPLALPEGTAIRVPKGQQILLNLHLYNANDEDLSGLSGTRIIEIPESDVTDLAEGILAGTVRLSIPPNEEKTHTGYCTMSQDTTVFAVAPHMHQLGVHERVFLEPEGGEPIKIHDEPYSFDEQSYRLIEPVELAKGDRVRVECTHRNTTAKTVTFGESSFQEMCFAGLYRVPATGGFFVCTDDFPTDRFGE